MTAATGTERVKIDRVTITKRRGKGPYYADFHHLGQHCRKSLKTTNLKVATQRARDLNAELTMGDFRQRPRRVLMSDAIADYLIHVESLARATGTQNRYRSVLARFQKWCQSRNRTALSQIDATLYEAYRSHLRTEVQFGESTLHDHSLIIKQWLKWLVARGLLSEHPLRLCRLTKPKRKARLVLSLSDVWKLLDTASARNRILLAVLAMTGMRCGELRHLRVEDIDLKRGWLAIVSRPGFETKTRASRRVPLHPALLRMLQQHRFATSGFAFCAPPSHKCRTGSNPINTGMLNNDLKALAEPLGLATGRRVCGLTLHSFRRFMETHAVNCGIPQRCVDAWLGHTSDKSMGATYYDLTDEQSQQFMTRLPLARPE